MKSDAILIVNMGGPSTEAEVKPYLKAIFRDPLILPIPAPIRQLVGARILARRAPAVAARYKLIGGGSPLLRWTQKLQRQMQKKAMQHDAPRRVEYAFRYTSPTIPQALAAMKKEGVTGVTLVPLFPHYTLPMTGSIRKEAGRAAKALGMTVTTVPAFWDQPAVLAIQKRYLAAAVEKAGSSARVQFVAHGIPMRNVRKGDPYPDQVRGNAEALAASLPKGTAWSLAFQSRVGPVEWTRPYLDDELERLATSTDPVVIMPISFVADCLETQYDLDIVAAERLHRAGIETLVRVPAFNADPAFAGAMLTVAKETIHE